MPKHIYRLGWMLGLRPALNQPPPLASPAHTFAILIICLPLKAIQGATSSYVSTFDVDCDGDGDGGSDCMRDGAYKFCALFIFLFLFFFFEWSRNFCAVASGMQPRQQHQQQLQLQNSFGRPAAEAEAECKGGLFQHKEERFRAGTVEAITINNQVWETFCGRNGNCGVIPNRI